MLYFINSPPIGIFTRVSTTSIVCFDNKDRLYLCSNHEIIFIIISQLISQVLLFSQDIL